jgi:4-amino-4-deoxy-L-arabinose transferase-like glycosyltransferase
LSSLKNKTLIMVAIIAVAGIVLMLLATNLGIGVFPDSVTYFDAARNLAEGRGLVVISGTRFGLVPLTHYPPLYSLLLAPAAAFGVTLETAARWLNAILFGANILLVGVAIKFCVRDSVWLPVTGAFLTLTAPDVLAIHSVAMTEPLYLLLTLGGLLLLAGYRENGRRVFLLGAAIAISLSCLTRYVGVVGVGTGIVALLFFDDLKREGAPALQRPEYLRKLIDVLIFTAIALGPIALWLIKSRLTAGSTADRQLSFHPIKFRQIVPAFSAAAQWLLLGKVRTDVRFAAFIIEVAVLLSLAAYMYVKRIPLPSKRPGESRLPLLLSIFSIFYVVFLVLTISFVEIDNVLDTRSLLPIHFLLLVIVPWLAGSIYQRVPKKVRVILVILLLMLSVSYTWRSSLWFTAVRAEGQGYAGHAWRESPTIHRINSLPPGQLIYANGVDAIYYLTGRRALEIPAKIIHGTAQPNARYEAELQRMTNDLRANNGVVVYFNTLAERWFLPTENELKNGAPLIQSEVMPDGTLYKVSPTGGK